MFNRRGDISSQSALAHIVAVKAPHLLRKRQREERASARTTLDEKWGW